MSKIFFLPVNTGYFLEGIPTKTAIDFYSSRSGNGLYCSIVGNVVIKDGHPTNGSCGVISADNSWRLLAKSIEARGAIPGIQLASTWLDYQGQKSFITKNQNAQLYYQNVAAKLTLTGVNNFFKNLEISTEIAIKAGFKHIQVHAAHGYLLSLLIDSQFSPFSEEVISRLIDWNFSTKKNVLETSVRISWFAGFEERIESVRQIQLIKMFNAGFDYIDLSEGYYNFNKHLIYPSVDKQLVVRMNSNKTLATKNPKQNFITSGRIDLNKIAELPLNLHVGICRDLIANPEYLQNKIQKCTNQFQCHYFSTGKQQLSCGAWEKQ